MALIVGLAAGPSAQQPPQQPVETPRFESFAGVNVVSVDVVVRDSSGNIVR
jgi:hypothetical protein